MEKTNKDLKFYGGKWMAMVPLVVFIAIVVLMYTRYFRAMNLRVTYVAAFVALAFGCVLSKDWTHYWDAIGRGIREPIAALLVIIMFTIGMFAEMVKYSGISNSFVWLGSLVGISGAAFLVFSFLLTCLVATATGTSIGSMGALYPILYPAGVLLGSHPLFLAGAIFGGAIFGDNLAPVSDTTIVSANTQTYTRLKDTVTDLAVTADIGGVVGSRLKYSLAAAALTCVILFIFGGRGHVLDQTAGIAAKGNPKAFLMLIPVAVLLIVSYKTKSLFKASISATILGTIIGLVSGLFKPTSIIGVTTTDRGMVFGGYLFTGIEGNVSVVVLLLVLFGMAGMLREAGILEAVISGITRSKFAETPRGNEVCIAGGIIASSMLLCGNTGASILMFGPMANEIGQKQKIHPYRRANLVDGFANTLPVIFPFASGLLFRAVNWVNLLAADPSMSSYIKPVTPVEVAGFAIYPMALFVMLIIAVLTGWGRRFEGENGAPVKQQPQ
jgi:Na+/H+ antiporter NhaC